jgi:hypothetical protein
MRASRCSALALGLILLTTVRSYYQEREELYLVDNAQGFSLKLAEATKEGIDLQPQVEGLSFVVQARIRLFGLHKEVLADSGKPQPTDISLGAVAFNMKAPQPPAQPPDRLTIITINKRPEVVTDTLPLAFPPSDTLLEMEQRDFVYKAIPVAGPTFGLGLYKVSLDESGEGPIRS